MVSADGYTVKLGPNYSVSEGVKGIKERGTKTATMTTMTTTETVSLLLPSPGWNKIKFIIGFAGNNSVDSWVLLVAGSFRCVALGGGVDSRE